MEREQELYDLKRVLAAEQASRRFLEEELEILQKEKETFQKEKEHLAKSLKELSDFNRNSILEWKTKVDALESQNEEEKKKQAVTVNELKEQLSCLKVEQDKADQISVSEMEFLKDRNKALEQKLEGTKCECDQLLQDQMQLIKQNEDMIETKNELNNALFCKRQELTTCLERCDALQEEIVLLKIENNAFKSAPPTHSTKGNSVFAEVDDNRKSLKNSLDKLADKYNVVKKELKSKSSEILKLRAEKSSLLRKVQEVCSKFGNNESNLIDSYKERIKDLETTVEKLKQEKDHVTNSGDYKAIDGLFAVKNKMIETLEEKVEKLSQTMLLQNETIFFLKRDLEIQTAQAAFELTEKMRLQEMIDAKALADQ